MAYKTPKWFLDLQPNEVQQVFHIWNEKYRNHYPNVNPKDIQRFNPSDYDIECVRLDTINHSFILTKWGYAINFTKYEVLSQDPQHTWNATDGVFYPALKGRRISIMGMHGKNKGINSWDYKELCDKYLKSSHRGLSDNLPSNFVNPWF